jgi:hypothetical protein
MKKTVSIFLSLALCLAAQAQADSLFRLSRIIRGDIVAFAVDNLDNIYVLNSRNQLKKLGPNGDSLAVYNDVRKFGQATLVDVSNPLKVLLYYRDFSTVAVLDRFLNARTTLDIRKMNILQAKVIGQSYDNRIWVYDEAEHKLKKIDEEGNLLLETPDLRLVLGKAMSPVRIFDEDKYVYLYDSLKGAYVFDYFGALKNNILIPHWKNFKVAGKFIFGSRADTLFRYDITTFRVDEWKMPQALVNSKAFNFTSTKLYALKEDQLEVYTIK